MKGLHLVEYLSVLLIIILHSWCFDALNIVGFDLSCISQHGEYLPYPGDCTKFLRCSHDRALVFQCPANLEWNGALKTCDYPSDTECAIRMKRVIKKVVKRNINQQTKISENCTTESLNKNNLLNLDVHTAIESPSPLTGIFSKEVYVESELKKRLIEQQGSSNRNSSNKDKTTIESKLKKRLLEQQGSSNRTLSHKDKTVIEPQGSSHGFASNKVKTTIEPQGHLTGIFSTDEFSESELKKQFLELQGSSNGISSYKTKTTIEQEGPLTETFSTEVFSESELKKQFLELQGSSNGFSSNKTKTTIEQEGPLTETFSTDEFRESESKKQLLELPGSSNGISSDKDKTIIEQQDPLTGISFNIDNDMEMEESLENTSTKTTDSKDIIKLATYLTEIIQSKNPDILWNTIKLKDAVISRLNSSNFIEEFYNLKTVIEENVKLDSLLQSMGIEENNYDLKSDSYTEISNTTICSTVSPDFIVTHKPESNNNQSFLNLDDDKLVNEHFKDLPYTNNSNIKYNPYNITNFVSYNKNANITSDTTVNSEMINKNFSYPDIVQVDNLVNEHFKELPDTNNSNIKYNPGNITNVVSYNENVNVTNDTTVNSEMINTNLSYPDIVKVDNLVNEHFKELPYTINSDIKYNPDNKTDIVSYTEKINITNDTINKILTDFEVNHNFENNKKPNISNPDIVAVDNLLNEQPKELPITKDSSFEYNTFNVKPVTNYTEDKRNITNDTLLTEKFEVNNKTFTDLNENNKNLNLLNSDKVTHIDVDNIVNEQFKELPITRDDSNIQYNTVSLTDITNDDTENVIAIEKEHVKNINSEKTTILPIFNESIWSNPIQSLDVSDKISSTNFHEAYDDIRTNTLTELSTNAEFKSFLDKDKVEAQKTWRTTSFANELPESTMSYMSDDKDLTPKKTVPTSMMTTDYFNNEEQTTISSTIIEENLSEITYSTIRRNLTTDSIINVSETTSVDQSIDITGNSENEPRGTDSTPLMTTDYFSNEEHTTISSTTIEENLKEMISSAIERNISTVSTITDSETSTTDQSTYITGNWEKESIATESTPMMTTDYFNNEEQTTISSTTIEENRREIIASTIDENTTDSETSSIDQSTAVTANSEKEPMATEYAPMMTTDYYNNEELTTISSATIEDNRSVIISSTVESNMNTVSIIINSETSSIGQSIDITANSENEPIETESTPMMTTDYFNSKEHTTIYSTKIEENPSEIIISTVESNMNTVTTITESETSSIYQSKPITGNSEKKSIATESTPMMTTDYFNNEEHTTFFSTTIEGSLGEIISSTIYGNMTDSETSSINQSTDKNGNSKEEHTATQSTLVMTTDYFNNEQHTTISSTAIEDKLKEIISSATESNVNTFSIITDSETSTTGQSTYVTGISEKEPIATESTPRMTSDYFNNEEHTTISYATIEENRMVIISSSIERNTNTVSIITDSDSSSIDQSKAVTVNSEEEPAGIESTHIMTNDEEHTTLSSTTIEENLREIISSITERNTNTVSTITDSEASGNSESETGNSESETLGTESIPTMTTDHFINEEHTISSSNIIKETLSESIYSTIVDIIPESETTSKTPTYPEIISTINEFVSDREDDLILRLELPASNVPLREIIISNEVEVGNYLSKDDNTMSTLFDIYPTKDNNEMEITDHSSMSDAHGSGDLEDTLKYELSLEVTESAPFNLVVMPITEITNNEAFPELSLEETEHAPFNLVVMPITEITNNEAFPAVLKPSQEHQVVNSEINSTTVANIYSTTNSMDEPIHDDATLKTTHFNMFFDSETTPDPLLPFLSPMCQGENNRRQFQARKCSKYYQCFAGWAFLLNCHDGYYFDVAEESCIKDNKMKCSE